ncbi:MAG: calcium/sodium antiporter [Paracoccaceae bacterium]
MDIVLVVAGLGLLLLGGELLVGGAVGLALRWRVPPMVIGLTLVGFGTSLPELLTSVQAALRGSPGIALGNVVGSNTANILLIGGLAAAMAAIPVARDGLRRDGGWMLAAALAALALVFLPVIGRGAGLALLAGLAAFLWVSLRGGRAAPPTEELLETMRPAWSSALRMTLGLGLTVGGAAALVEGAVALATQAGLPEAVIGLTLVAVGTSLPELATSVIAARRGQPEVALGNILGSNVFNVLGILGVTALIAPLPVDAMIRGFDIWVMLAATLALLAVAWTGTRISRREGLALLLAYLVYVGWLARGLF